MRPPAAWVLQVLEREGLVDEKKRKRGGSYGLGNGDGFVALFE